jgi:L-seryl-tRNA(Ser) seleniumtransferase
MANPLRNLPSVNEILEAPAIKTLLVDHAHEVVASAVRVEIDALRKQLLAGTTVDGQAAVDTIANQVAQRLASELRPKLRRVINATGIILHTNLGRAPLAEAAASAARDAASGYLNLELELETGERSSRQDAIRDWVCRLVGAESATAVNNNAAATVIALRALAMGKEVIVSRGQLVEIGGSFRIPDIMRVSGAILQEVGTTNITRIRDYEAAITPETIALLRVHTSNYRITGHTESATLDELVEVARRRGLIVIDDLGSGALIDYRRWGFEGEPLAKGSLAAGADLVLFSGDKLLGGPQAGILAGRRDLIQKIEKDPLMRAFRLDKMTLAALEATLRIYLNEEQALEQIPILRMIQTPLETLQSRAKAIARKLKKLDGIESVEVREDIAYVGGGSLPDQKLATVVVALKAKSLSDSELAQRLRTGDPAVLPRVQDGRVLLDVRTVFEEQVEELVEACGKVMSNSV